MRIQIKRPVIWVTISYIAGILLSSILKSFSWVYIAWITAVFCLLIGFLLLKKGKPYLSIIILLLFMWTGFVNGQIARVDFSGLNSFQGSTLNLTGQVLEVVRYDSDRAVYDVQVEYVEDEGRKYLTRGKIRLSQYFYGEGENRKIFSPGDIIRIRGELRKPQGRRNPRGFDYRGYLEKQGIFYTVNVSESQVELIGTKPFKWPYSWIIAVHNWLKSIMEKNLREPVLALVKSMIIGDKGGLPYRLRDEFSKTGLAHILAISGLHVGYIVLALSAVQRFLKLPPKIAFLAQALFLGFYCLLVGGAASAIRAAIMAIIVMGGRLLGRRPDPVNSMALAALIVLIFRPLDIYDVGFQLSFGAVGGIFLYSNRIKKALKFLPNFISNSISVSLAAQLGTWPLILYYFNIISPWSVLTNLLLVPIAGIVVILGFIMLIISLVLPWLGSFIGYIIEYIGVILIRGNNMMASLPGASIKMVSPSIMFLTIYYLILWLMSEEKPAFIKRPLLWAGGAIALLLGLAFIKYILPVPMQIVFLDVGQGDCIYIRTPDRKHILIDGGGRPEGLGDFDVGEDIVVPFLLKNGIGRLDLVVMSHSHDDHIGGLIPVVRDIKVAAFMEFPPKDISENYLQLKELVKQKGITCIYAVQGQSYQIGKKAWIDILYPMEDQARLENIGGDNENNRSLVMRLSYKNTSILFTGDIEREVEEYLSDIYDFEVDILKVAHHGSRTSSTEPWIQIIDPQIAVIQVGRNIFGHPHPEVEERLLEQGASVYRSDRDGAVICTFINGKWNVYTMVNE